MSSKALYLESDEEITTAIDKIRSISEKDVALVIPKRSFLLQSIVNLKLLKKQSQKINKNITIVTPDKTGQTLAAKVGLAYQSNLKGKTIKPPSGVLTNKSPLVSPDKKDEKAKNLVKKEKAPIISEPPSEITQIKSKPNKLSKILPKDGLDDINPKRKKIKHRENNKINLLPSFSLKILIAFLTFSIIITSIIVFIILPNAEIKIVPKTEPFITEFEMIADSSTSEINYDQNYIPGKLISITKNSEKKTFEATGKKDIGGKSSGVLIVYNNFSSEDQPLVENTRFQTPDGKVFRSTRQVNVPGASVVEGNKQAGTISVEVIADANGEEYNISPTKLTIPGLPGYKQSGIFAENTEAFSGGSAKVLNNISEEDFAKAKETLTEELIAASIGELKERTPKEFVFINDAVRSEVIESNSNQEVGSEAASFDLEIKSEIATVVFLKEDYRKFIFDKIDSQISEDKYIINKELNSGINPEVKSLDIDSKKLGLNLKISKHLGHMINIEEIQGLIAGKTESEILDILNKYENIIDKEVEFWPFWVKKTPRIDKKVQITIDTSQINDKILPNE